LTNPRKPVTLGRWLGMVVSSKESTTRGCIAFRTWQSLWDIV